MENISPKIELVGISKQFPGVKALDRVSLSVAKGSVHVVMGENGAGKSTLMKIINGIYKMDEGAIKIDGEEVHISNPQEAQAHGIAMIFQELNYFPELTVAENIFMSRLPGKKVKGIVDWESIYKQTDEFLEKENLSFSSKTKMKDLSIADIQLLEIMKAVSFKASIILMDEPTSSLTVKETEFLFAKIKELKQRGISIIYISHKMDEIFRIADMITVMRDGCTIETKPAEEYSNESLIRAMVGREITSIYPKEEVEIGGKVLELSNICIEDVLENINLYVRKGEILGISGLVGAGRTELARAVFGLDKITSGIVKINGEEVSAKNVAAQMRQGMAMLSEDRRNYGIVGIRSIRENIALSALNMSKGFLLNKAFLKNKTDELAQSLKVKAANLNQKIEDLSGGNQQKVLLARWLMINPQIMIMDEPTRGIDVGAKSEIYKIMVDLCRKGVAIIMISSELPELLGMADRMYVMREGRITKELSRDEFDQEIIMKYATGGR